METRKRTFARNLRNRFRLSKLAKTLQAQNNLAEAEQLQREALVIRRAAFTAGHPEIALGLNNLASILKSQNKLTEAEPLLSEALEIRRAAFPAGHPRLLAVMSNLADLYAKQGKIDQALPLLKELLESNRATLRKDSPELAGQLAAYSMTLLTLKAWDEAEPLIREALTIRETVEPDAWTTFNTKSMLGGALLGQKKFAESEPLLLAGFAGLKQRETTIPEQGKIRLLEALERLAHLYTDWHAVEPDKVHDAKTAKWQTNLKEHQAATTTVTPSATAKPKLGK